jgi:hypothetical protein
LGAIFFALDARIRSILMQFNVQGKGGLTLAEFAKAMII